jgi:hypothetical protein
MADKEYQDREATRWIASVLLDSAKAAPATDQAERRVKAANVAAAQQAYDQALALRDQYLPIWNAAEARMWSAKTDWDNCTGVISPAYQ